MNNQFDKRNKKFIYSALIVGLILSLLFWSFNVEDKQNSGVVVGTFLYGICLLYLGLVSGGLLIILRIFKVIKNQSNFFYIFFGLYNCCLGLLGCVLIIFRATDGLFSLFFIISFLLGLVIMFDVFSWNYARRLIVIFCVLSLLPILYWESGKIEQKRIVDLIKWKIYRPGVIPSDSAKYLEYQNPINTDSVKYFLSNVETVWPWEHKFESNKMLSGETTSGKVINIIVNDDDEFIEIYNKNISFRIPKENLASWHKFIEDHNVFR